MPNATCVDKSVRQCAAAPIGAQAPWDEVPGLSPMPAPAHNRRRDDGDNWVIGNTVISDGRRPRAASPPERIPARRPDSRRASGRDPEWLEDIALVAAACQDAEAFGRLYDRYSDRIYRFVARRLRDRMAAEDVTAEVFFKALRALNAYQPDMAPFSAWLYRIAANTVTDQLRARKVASPLETALGLPDGADPVEQQAINRVEVDRVWAAVDRLTPAQRTAIILRLGHDLPLAEISALMNRSEGSVKLLLHRGLIALRSLLSVRAVRPRRTDVRVTPRSRREGTG